MNEINADQDVVRGLGAWGCPAKRGRTAQPPAFRKGERGYGTLFDGILMDVSIPVVDGIEAGGIDYLVKPYAQGRILDLELSSMNPLGRNSPLAADE